MNNDRTKDSSSPFLIYIARLIMWCAGKILWRIKFIDTQNIPQNLSGGLLVVSNHQTYLDPFWISLPIRRDLRYMAWEDAFDWFFVGWLIKKLGAFPVNTTFGSSKSYKQAARFLKEGKTLILFPEAAREFSDGKLLPFKSGAAKLALHTKVPVLPVTVRGGNRVWAREMKFPHLKKVEIVFHPLLESKTENEQISAEHLTEKFRAIIENTP